MGLLNQNNFFGKSLPRQFKPSIFGMRQLGPGDSTVNACCTYQTTDPEAANYIPACCVAQWLDDKLASGLSGTLLKNTSLFREVPRRPQ